MTDTATKTAEQRSAKRLMEFLRGLLGKEDAHGQKRERQSDVLAHLRRGLGRKPGEAMEMYPYVGRFACEEESRAHERAVFLTSALFALYPDAELTKGNFGDSIRMYEENLVPESERKKKDRPKHRSTESRFVALLDANADDLHYYLRQMISLLKANNVPVDWEQLFRDIRNWSHDDRFVQREWARSFWGSKETKEENNSETTGGEEQ